jgi:CRISPR type III-A-associated RAMP protein Csm4
MPLAGNSSSFTVRFRPLGPWRFGPENGARDRVSLIYHSDAVYSAVCAAMSQLGLAEDWLNATARSVEGPAVCFSSFYPFHGKTLLIVPPRTLWPPPESAKVRYKGARFVPLSVVQSLLSEKTIDENRWAVDGESECLASHDGGQRGPFKIALRSAAAVDRLDASRLETHGTACLEFARDAGLWTVVQFAGDEALEKWKAPVRSALQLLADSGFGGERSRGWGRSDTPEWDAWRLPTVDSSIESAERAHWLLSLYLPAADDSVDWKRGSYSLVTRHGRIESGNHWGEAKAATQMIAEGSVLLSSAATLRGAVRDTAPAGFPHPVYRSGFAVTVPIPFGATSKPAATIPDPEATA